LRNIEYIYRQTRCALSKQALASPFSLPQFVVVFQM